MEKRLLDLSSRTVRKILRRMGIGCFVCSWNEATCDIHHRIHKKNGGSDEETNLTVVCPNCHRIAHEHKISNQPTIAEKIGDRWREYYYNERKAADPAVRAQISRGMKKAHLEGRAWNGRKEKQRMVGRAANCN